MQQSNLTITENYEAVLKYIEILIMRYPVCGQISWAPFY